MAIFDIFKISKWCLSFFVFNAHVLPVLSFIITYFLVLTHLPLALQRYKHISTVAILVFCITSLVRSEHSNC